MELHQIKMRVAIIKTLLEKSPTPWDVKLWIESWLEHCKVLATSVGQMGLHAVWVDVVGSRQPIFWSRESWTAWYVPVAPALRRLQGSPARDLYL